MSVEPTIAPRQRPSERAAGAGAAAAPQPRQKPRERSRRGLPGWLFAIGAGLILLLAALVILAVAVGPIVAPAVWDFVLANVPFFRFLVATTAVLLMTVPTAFVIIYMEMKGIALINLRIGPDRVGPFGSLMSVVHGLKVLVKEDFTPTGADRVIFTLAPVVVFLTTVMCLLVIPFAPGMFGQDLNMGVLYFFAVSGMTVIGLLMAGWSSFNKYSLLGGLRAAAQIISYEIPLTLSVVGVIILAGSMSMNQIVESQSGSFLDWNIIRQPLGFVIFFIALTAEASRTPFDLTEADSEIVAGFATEYSGMRFGFLFFAEYVNVFIISALATTLFLGGWTAPIPMPVDIHLPDLLGIAATVIATVGWIPIVAALVILPVVGTVAMGLPVKVVWRDAKPAHWLLFGFLGVTGIGMAVIGLLAFIGFEQVVGIVWFMLKCYTLVFVFVWMRATLPRVRIDQLMGFAWKWLLPASVLNIFVTALAVLLVAR